MKHSLENGGTPQSQYGTDGASGGGGNPYGIEENPVTAANIVQREKAINES